MKIKNNYFYIIGYLVLSFVVAAFVSLNSPHFPDFDGYNNYVEELTAFPRFKREPVSAFTMNFLGHSGFGGVAYYFISTLIFCFGCGYALLKVHKNNLLSFLYLVFNPISLILMHVPRFSMSIGIVLVAFYSGSKFKSIILTFLAIFTHNVLGVFYICLSFIKFLSWRTFSIAVVFACILFLMILNGWIDTVYSQYAVTEHDRGRLRAVYFLIPVVFYLFLIRLRDSYRLNLLILCIFIFILYLLTPYAHRFFGLAIIILAVEIDVIVKLRLNILVWNLFKFISVFSSLLLVLLGLYDYG